jgi:hypothetical protein
VRTLLSRHPVIAYTAARLAIFAGVLAVLSIVGLRGVALLIAALLVSGLLSAWLLVHQRDIMSDALAGRLTRIRSRLDEAAAAEDDEGDEQAVIRRTPPPAETDGDARRIS